MRVQVKLFAAAREAAGSDSILLDVADQATIADLRRALVDRLPKVREILARSMFAINCEFAGDETTVSAKAEVACIPPVSGG
jgi:molybdopterin converting factor subunit 1